MVPANCASDEQTCKTFLSSTNKTEVSDSDNAKLEATLGPKFYDQMMITTGKVMRAGNTGPERVLDDEMGQQHGWMALPTIRFSGASQCRFYQPGYDGAAVCAAGYYQPG